MVDPHPSRNDHQHHHEHHHVQSNSHDVFTEKNRAHWNDYAAKYTSQEWQRTMISQITGFLHTLASDDFLYPFSSSTAPRVLDYACGPGTITSALSTRCSSYIGMDISENMIAAYNARFGSDGSGDGDDKKLTARAVRGNLLVEDENTMPASLDEVEMQDFDLAIIGLGFHHFSNLELCVERLKQRLRVGGVFVIVDLVSHSGHGGPEGVKHIVAHNGFSEEQVRELFGKCGLMDFGFMAMSEEVLMHGTTPMRVFVARGVKGQ